MSDDGKPVVSQQEAEVRPKKGCKFKRHCGRFWWAYLLAFVIIAVLVVVLIIFVAVPKLAQHKVNDSELTIDSIVASDTQSENFTMSVNSSIHVPSPASATIAGFEGVMYLEDYEPHVPFARLAFPPTTGDANQVVNISQFTPITNLEAFTRFNTWLLLNESIRVTVEGDTTIRLSGLARDYPITFKKTVTLAGLQNFHGTFLPESSVSLTPDDDGNNFHGIVTVPNRSVVTFDIGNASFTSYLEGKEVGTTFIDNMVLVPGLNNFTLKANISQGAVLDALQRKPYCENGGNIPFQLSGKDVVNFGQHLTYYSDALGAANQTVTIPIGADLKRDHNLTLACRT